jgi:hypothetical protein
MLLLYIQLSYTIEQHPLQQHSITRLFHLATAFLAQNIGSADMITNLAEISPHLLNTPLHRTAENMISALVNVFEGHSTLTEAEQAIHQEMVSAYMTLHNL